MIHSIHSHTQGIEQIDQTTTTDTANINGTGGQDNSYPGMYGLEVKLDISPEAQQLLQENKQDIQQAIQDGKLSHGQAHQEFSRSIKEAFRNLLHGTGSMQDLITALQGQNQQLSQLLQGNSPAGSQSSSSTDQTPSNNSSTSPTSTPTSSTGTSNSAGNTTDGTTSTNSVNINS